MKHALLLSIIVFCFSSCYKPDWKEVEVERLNGARMSLGDNKGSKMLFFLSPECPLCENYALNINKIFGDSIYNDIQKFGVFPGEYYSRSQIEAYKIKYEIKMTFILDPNYELTRSLNATVTPEVFLFDKNDHLVYSGAIDNWMVSLGKKRTKITDEYLLNALNSLKKGKTILIKKTKAVGCYIE